MPVNARSDISAFENWARGSERHRISRELHDSTLQLLAALQLQVGQLRKFPAARASQSILDEMAETIQSIRESIRQIESGRAAAGLANRPVRTVKVFLSLATERQP
jgi:signal transduction histidine kinase